MQYTTASLSQFDFQAEDDIDRLFNRLAPIEPACELVARILVQVRRLPVSSARQNPIKKGLDTLVVRNERRGPS